NTLNGRLTSNQVFILGVNFPERNLKSLESFFGIGNLTSTRLLARFHIHPTCKVGDLANKQVLDITAALSDMKIENDLRRQYLDNIKRLKETGTYRGRRHALGLPVRGQRTRSQWSCGFVSIGAWNGVINSLL
ncbi:hypothetical protein ASPNIDRAFT_143563, partial [Aspergillus niger ATCC 1015]